MSNFKGKLSLVDLRAREAKEEMKARMDQEKYGKVSPDEKQNTTELEYVTGESWYNLFFERAGLDKEWYYTFLYVDMVHCTIGREWACKIISGD